MSSCATGRVRMILLGVGTAVPDPRRGYTHMVFDGPGGPILIDAGGDVYQRLLLAGIEPPTLRGIILTHSHADHINGLPALLFSLALVGVHHPIPIYGLGSTLDRVRDILQAFELGAYCVPVEWQPVQPGDRIPLEAQWTIQTAGTEHPRPCIALRIQGPHGHPSLTYSADTAPCQAVLELARHTTVLLHEATTATPSEGHTTPAQAGQIAVQAAAHRLVLVHFSPTHTMPEPQAIADVRAAGFSGPAEVGQEYQVIVCSESTEGCQ